jgi:monoamine oxidase
MVLPDYAVPPYQVSKQDYLARLSGWRHDQRARRREIAIVGAGMAGLVCGWLLRRAGHAVTVFEASHVVGGRVKTLRDRFTSGFHAEAGAMRIPEDHLLTRWLVRDLLGLETAPFSSRSANGLIYINGRRATEAGYRKRPAQFDFALAPHERALDAEAMFERALACYMERTHAIRDFDIASLARDDTAQIRARNRALLHDLDKHSLRSFLMEEAFLAPGRQRKLSRGAVDMIVALLAAEVHLSLSMAAIVSDYRELAPHSALYQIVGGMDRLPKAFAGEGGSLRDGSDLAASIRYNERVIEIDAKGRKLCVIFEDPVTRRRRSDSYDLVVIATPFSALRHIRMGGLVGAEKRRAVRQLHYDNSCKIIIEFEQCFWARRRGTHPPIDGGRSITDLPIRQVYYPSAPRAADRPAGRLARGLLLASYTWGEESLRWTSLKRDDRVRFALRDLERLHGITESLAYDCVGGTSHSWTEDEFTLGAFAMFEPYQLTELFDDVWRPEGRLHFAGEHTSTKHGWIEGAVESAVRVASEICARVAAERG